MSGFNARWQQAQQGTQGAGEEWAAFRQLYPTLADVFFGVPSTKDDQGRPACKIMVFPEADKLKFMLSPNWGNLVAFGTFSDPTGGFENLEHELAEGRFEWKKRKR